MIRLKFTKHAQDMIQHRGVDVDHIKRVIREPALLEKLAHGKVIALGRIDPGRQLRVVYSHDGTIRGTTDYLIITVYYI